MFLLTVSILFIVACLLLIVYYLFFFTTIFHYSNLRNDGFEPSISVIICAHNEAENLKNNIPLLCNQLYSNKEIIVVNDASDDHTLSVLDDLSKQFDCLKIITIQRKNTEIKGKKYALQQGVLQAKNEYVLFTDADCKPVSEYWIKQMAQRANHADVVLGFAPYTKCESFLNKVIQYETLHTAMQYMGYAHRGWAYMSVGRNVLYRIDKLDMRILSTIGHLPSGDDDLLLQSIKNKARITTEYSPETFMYSEPEKSWKSWANQKARHLSTGKYYAAQSKLLLGLYAISQMLFWLLLPLVFWHYHIALFTIMMVKILVQLYVFSRCAKLFQQQFLYSELLFFDFFLVLYNTYFSKYIFIKNKATWK